jgi:uncharacterized membrane protein YfcA
MTSQVVGNVIGTFVISKIPQSSYFIFMTALTLVASIYLFFLPRPRPQPDTPEIKEDEETVDVKKDVRDTWELMKSPRMLKLLPIVVWSSFSVAIYAA